MYIHTPDRPKRRAGAGAGFAPKKPGRGSLPSRTRSPRRPQTQKCTSQGI